MRDEKFIFINKFPDFWCFFREVLLSPVHSTSDRGWDRREITACFASYMFHGRNSGRNPGSIIDCGASEDDQQHFPVEAPGFWRRTGREARDRIRSSLHSSWFQDAPIRRPVGATRMIVPRRAGLLSLCRVSGPSSPRCSPHLRSELEGGH